MSLPEELTVRLWEEYGRALNVGGKSMLVIPIDPGSTTGLAALRPPATLVYSDEIWDRAKAIAWVLFNEPDVVVIEDFKPHLGLPEWAHLPAPKVIGALETAIAEKLPGTKIILQSPSVKKTFPDTLLKAAGMHKPGRPHANDAVRHGLYYLWITLELHKDPAVQAIYRRHIELVMKERMNL